MYRAQAKNILYDLPAVAWMAYSIHGNESSGSDAALAMIYQLLSANDTKTQAMLDDMVILQPDDEPGWQITFHKGIRRAWRFAQCW